MKASKPKPLYKPDDDPLFRLFDSGEMEHVYGLLVGLADPVPRAEREAMAAALRKLLGKPIAVLLNRIGESGRGAQAAEWDALERFALAVEVTAKRLGLSEPLDSAEAGELALDLRAAWLEFIAYAGAHRMYADMPRELAINSRKTAPLLASRKTVTAHARGDHDRIRADYARLKAEGARGIAKTLAKKYDRSPGGIRNIWSKRLKN
jgi:hypothetical protein